MLATRMSLCLSTAAFLPDVGIGIVRSRYAPFMSLASGAYEYIRPSGDTNRRRTVIDTLDDDSLLNIFYHRRPVLLGGRCGYGSDIEDTDNELLEGGGWERERWWYKRAQVCRRW